MASKAMAGSHADQPATTSSLETQLVKLLGAGRLHTPSWLCCGRCRWSRPLARRADLAPPLPLLRGHDLAQVTSSCVGGRRERCPRAFACTGDPKVLVLTSGESGWWSIGERASTGQPATGGRDARGRRMGSRSSRGRLCIPPGRPEVATYSASRSNQELLVMNK